jgi:hypothetical protein
MVKNFQKTHYAAKRQNNALAAETFASFRFNLVDNRLTMARGGWGGMPVVNI